MSTESTTLPGYHVYADLDRILIDRDHIAHRVAELADEISHDLRGVTDHDELVLVSVLIRQLPQKLRIEVIGVESYPGRATTSRGAKITTGLSGGVENRHVLIVDDILDSGGTLKLIREEVTRRRAKTVQACVLLRKQRQSALATPCEYVGFDIPDVFVVGYGLDYNNYYRNLPDIGTLKETAL
jgi:hypoxanthine phosphoribosyltransferase